MHHIEHKSLGGLDKTYCAIAMQAALLCWLVAYALAANFDSPPLKRHVEELIVNYPQTAESFISPDSTGLPSAPLLGDFPNCELNHRIRYRNHLQGPILTELYDRTMNDKASHPDNPLSVKFYENQAVEACFDSIFDMNAPGLYLNDEPLTFGELINALTEHVGCPVFPHGGAVRDCLMGRVPNDVDVAFGCPFSDPLQQKAKLNIIARLADQEGWEYTFEDDWYIKLGSVEPGNPMEPFEGCLNHFLQTPMEMEFSVNMLSYDPVSKLIIDLSGTGVDDLCDPRNARFSIPVHNRYLWGEWFMENPYKALRAWKLRRRGFVIDREELQFLTRSTIMVFANPNNEVEVLQSHKFFCEHLVGGTFKTTTSTGVSRQWCSVVCDMQTYRPDNFDRLKQLADVLLNDFEAFGLSSAFLLERTQYLCEYPDRLLGGSSPTHGN